MYQEYRYLTEETEVIICFVLLTYLFLKLSIVIVITSLSLKFYD